MAQMQIKDSSGQPLDEVVIEMGATEVTDLLVSLSQLDDGTNDHAFYRAPDGSAIAIYTPDTDPTPLQKGTDWWIGPLILVAVLLVVVGAFTVARGLVNLLF